MTVDQSLLVLTCPACGQRMKAPAAARGKTYKCVKCGEHVLVDAPNIADAADETEGGSAAARAHEPVGQLLLKEGLITREQLSEALAIQQSQGGKTFEILIDREFLDKDALHTLLSRQPGIATIQLDRVQLDREIIALVPRALAIEHMLLPIDRLGKLLTVAMACPMDVATIAEMEKHTGLKVKAMLCRLDEIHLAVEKYYPEGNDGEGGLATFELPANFGSDKSENIGDKIKKLEHLITSSAYVERLVKLAENPAANPRDMALSASADPAIAVALLRTANSAAYGMHRQVDSVSLAMTMLGHSGAATVSLACSNGAAGEDLDLAPLYERARRAAIAAAAIAKASGHSGRSVAHTAGLLHELGRIVLASTSPQGYKKIDMNLTGSAACEQEKKALGFTHPEAGAILANRWSLPGSLCDALRNYLSPDAAVEASELAAIVGLAAVAAGGDSSIDQIATQSVALSILGMRAEAVSEAVKAALGG